MSIPDFTLALTSKQLIFKRERIAERMGAYPLGQKLRKEKINVGKLHGAGCLLIGQRKENFFPNMRVHHGLHMHRPKAILGFHESVEVIVSKLEMIQNIIYHIVVRNGFEARILNVMVQITDHFFGNTYPAEVYRLHQNVLC